MTFDGFHRGGHLTELALDRLASDPAATDPAFATRAAAHLEGCPECRAARDALAARDRGFALAPRADLVARADRLARADRPPGGWRRYRAAAGAALALAAAALLIAMPFAGSGPPDPEEDRMVAKGGALDLEINVNDGARTRVVDDGGVVYPGERAGFALRASEDGWVLVFGWDQRGAPWPAYPSAAANESLPAVPIAKSKRPARVAAAVRFDALLGAEHVAAVWCPHPFTLGDLAPNAIVDEAALRDATPAGCSLRHLVLYKRPRPDGSSP